jgi:hypothetical protein
MSPFSQILFVAFTRRMDDYLPRGPRLEANFKTRCGIRKPRPNVYFDTA